MKAVPSLSSGQDAPLLCSCAWRKARGQDLEWTCRQCKGILEGPRATQQVSGSTAGLAPVSEVSAQLRDWEFSAPWNGQLHGGCPRCVPTPHVPPPVQACAGVSSSERGTRPLARETKIKKTQACASLVAQWLRIHLPMQGTRVRALVREDPNPTCRGATKPVHHNF